MVTELLLIIEMSLSALLSSIEAAIILSEKAFFAAENAVGQAKSALEAAKITLVNLKKEEQNPQPTELISATRKVEKENERKKEEKQIEDIQDISDDDELTNSISEGRKQYSRGFLLALKNVPFSRQKPANLPDIEIVKRDFVTRFDDSLKGSARNWPQHIRDGVALRGGDDRDHLLLQCGADCSCNPDDDNAGESDDEEYLTFLSDPTAVILDIET